MITVHKILAVGTQVVSLVAVKNLSGETIYPVGAAGTIVTVEDDNRYQVRFPNGYETLLKRSELDILKHMQRGEFQPPPEEVVDYHQYIIYHCIVGSRAYGLEQEGSDTDRRGIYLPPAAHHWSLYHLPEQIEDDAEQSCFWEVEKFLTLALKANPNILECLYTPLIEEVTPLAQELLDHRGIFLSQLIYQTYNGYVMSQFKKLNHHMEKHGQIKWKHAMHLIRLLLSGRTILREGFVPVQVEEHREQLLAVRRGEVAWDEVNAWRLSLHKEFDQAFSTTKLPQWPNYELANRFLVKARRQAVSFL